MYPTSATRSKYLTDYAKGVIPAATVAVVDRIAPIVLVSSNSGQYRDWNIKNAFQVVDASRGQGGKATMLQLDATSPAYVCRPYGLDMPIDDFTQVDVEFANADREAAVETLVQIGATSRMQVLKTNIDAITAESGKGVWLDNSGDPIAEMNEQIVNISKASGSLPNLVVIDPTSLNIAGNNTKTIARQPGAAQIGAITASWLSSVLLGNPEVLIAANAQDTTKRGVAAANAFSLANTVLIMHSSRTPNIYDLSAFKTFRSRATGGVRMYRDESRRSDVLALDWFEDIKTVSSPCVKKITVS